MKRTLAMLAVGLFMVASTVAIYAQDTTAKKINKKGKKAKKGTDTSKQQ